jgi:hypothetical protein
LLVPIWVLGDQGVRQELNIQPRVHQLEGAGVASYCFGYATASSSSYSSPASRRCFYGFRDCYNRPCCWWQRHSTCNDSIARIDPSPAFVDASSTRSKPCHDRGCCCSSRGGSHHGRRDCISGRGAFCIHQECMIWLLFIKFLTGEIVMSRWQKQPSHREGMHALIWSLFIKFLTFGIILSSLKHPSLAWCLHYFYLNLKDAVHPCPGVC